MSLKIVRLSIFFLVLSMVSCGVSDEDYDNMAKTYCECMTSSKERPNPSAITCIQKVKKESEDLILDVSNEDFKENLLEAMKKQEGCEESMKLIK